MMMENVRIYVTSAFSKIPDFPSRHWEWQCSEKATRMRSICCASPGKRNADKKMRMQSSTDWLLNSKLSTYRSNTKVWNSLLFPTYLASSLPSSPRYAPVTGLGKSGARRRKAATDSGVNGVGRAPRSCKYFNPFSGLSSNSAEASKKMCLAPRDAFIKLAMARARSKRLCSTIGVTSSTSLEGVRADRFDKRAVAASRASLRNMKVLMTCLNTCFTNIPVPLKYPVMNSDAKVNTRQLQRERYSSKGCTRSALVGSQSKDTNSVGRKERSDTTSPRLSKMSSSSSRRKNVESSRAGAGAADPAVPEEWSEGIQMKGEVSSMPSLRKCSWSIKRS
mmetsp:Transcript_32875/g.56166  ORF Transcript_32875/g.56166 Transcript_32875/m.56166 type:complete len:335 (+) Transcript_32875:3532-4536(+)